MATGGLVGQDTAAKTKPMFRDRLAFLFIGTLGCLILGGLFALWMTEQRSDASVAATLAPTVIPSQTPPAVVGEQRAILLTVVDSRNTARPTLEGVWVLTFTPNTSQYYWVGFSTKAVVPATNQTLESYFNNGPTLDDGVEFTRTGLSLLTEGVIQPTYTVSVDRTVLAELVTIIGGISLDGQHLNGDQLLARYDSLTADQQLQFQKIALEAFVREAQARTWTSDLIKMFYYRYQSASPDADELAGLAGQALPFTEAQFTFNLWGEPSAP